MSFFVKTTLFLSHSLNFERVSKIRLRANFYKNLQIYTKTYCKSCGIKVEFVQPFKLK